MERKTVVVISIILLHVSCLHGQEMKIKGFFDFNASYKDNKSSVALGEQDLFITSELSDRFSFLGAFPEC